MVSKKQYKNIVPNLRKDEELRLLGSLKNQINTYAFGPHGIGKTTLAKKVTSDYQKMVGDAVYIDCSLYQTANAILRETLLSLNIVISSKNNYDLIKRLKNKIKKNKIVLVLDQFENAKKTEILKIILGMNITVLIVSDSVDQYRRTSVSTKSRISNIIEIREFSQVEKHEIVKEHNLRISDEIIKKIIQKTKNLSLAVSLSESLKTIPLQQQNQYLEQFFSQIMYSDTTLKEDKKLILEILKENKRLKSGDLYHLYCERSPYPKGERAFRNYMLFLRNKGFVKALGEKKGRIYEIIENRFNYEK